MFDIDFPPLSHKEGLASPFLQEETTTSSLLFGAE